VSDQFKVCSTCRKAIHFGASYYQCSVSTCQRQKTALFFCSVECWDAHLPMMRHREAWAEAMKAPSREEWAALEQEEAARTAKPVEDSIVNDGNDSNAAVGGGEDAPREVLIVVSKLKSYIKAKSGMNTSDGIVPVLSDLIRDIADRAIESARSDGRKTVLDRDVKPAGGG
jgi:hypothetical protein